MNWERFWSYVNVTEPDDCWEWTRCKHKRGYGRFQVNRKAILAHRLACEYEWGSPEVEGLYVLHSCDNPKCCNPSHLRWGTQKENMEDALKRNRIHSGENNHHHKLMRDQVESIKADPRILKEIAKEYGVCQKTISYIKNGKTWK